MAGRKKTVPPCILTGKKRISPYCYCDYCKTRRHWKAEEFTRFYEKNKEEYNAKYRIKNAKRRLAKYGSAPTCSQCGSNKSAIYKPTGKERWYIQDNKLLCHSCKSVVTNKGRPSPRRGVSFTPEHREKLRQAKLRNPMRYWLGKKRDPEMMKRIWDKNRGRPSWNAGKTGVFGKSTLQLWSKQRKGRAPPNKGKPSPLRGRKHSPETIQKIRLARAKQPIPFKDTKIEVALQNALRQRAIPFETHKAIVGQPDIFIEPNICIFCDGDYWHAHPERFKPDEVILNKEQTSKEIWIKDAEVSRELIELGYVVLRFWEREINKDAAACLEVIQQAIEMPIMKLN